MIVKRSTLQTNIKCSHPTFGTLEKNIIVVNITYKKWFKKTLLSNFISKHNCSVIFMPLKIPGDPESPPHPLREACKPVSL
jgi:hypothetical protein